MLEAVLQVSDTRPLMVWPITMLMDLGERWKRAERPRKKKKLTIGSQVLGEIIGDPLEHLSQYSKSNIGSSYYYVIGGHVENR
jgi:hypothetical protein